MQWDFRILRCWLALGGSLAGGVDNTVLNAGTGGDTIATDDIAGVKHQLIKVEFGAADSATQVADAAAARLPVKVGEELPAGTQNIGDVDIAGVTPVAGRVPVDGSGVTQPVSGTVTANAGTGTLATDPIDRAARLVGQVEGRAADGVAVAGNPMRIAGKDGGGLTQDIATDAAGELQIDVLTLPALVAGTANIGDVDVLSMPTGASAAQVQGTVAHDGVDAQNPVGVAYRAIAHGANPTAVAAADRTVGYANRAGVPFVIGGHPNIVTLEFAATAAQTDAAIVTIAGGLKIVVTQIQMLADNANTVDVGFRVGFGATTTPTTTGVVLSHPGVAAGSGVSRGDGSGILGVGADGEDLRITSEVPTGGSIRIVVSYFTIES